MTANARQNLELLALLGLGIMLAVLATGCARSVTNQKDHSTIIHAYDIDATTGRTNRTTTTETRATTTRASATSAVSSSQTFKGLNASQDGQAQGLRIDEAHQKSEIDKALDVLGRLAPLAGAMYGVPLGGGSSTAPPPPPASLVYVTNWPTPPAGMKWGLQPVDNPSTPQPID